MNCWECIGKRKESKILEYCHCSEPGNAENKTSKEDYPSRGEVYIYYKNAITHFLLFSYIWFHQLMSLVFAFIEGECYEA